MNQGLNQHYTGKRVAIDRDEGLIVELDNRDRIPPHQLSSGEQQILVLAYELLFRALPGTLVLLDEPELSLHVLWQARLIDDLTEMVELRGLGLVVATHSPVIIAGRDDAVISLDTELADSN